MGIVVLGNDFRIRVYVGSSMLEVATGQHVAVVNIIRLARSESKNKQQINTFCSTYDAAQCSIMHYKPPPHALPASKVDIKNKWARVFSRGPEGGSPGEPQMLHKIF